MEPKANDKDSLFISRNRNRITKCTVELLLVKKYIAAAGLDSAKYSAHKLRHTAATLMYQSTGDVRVLKEVLGHSNLNTTQIYVHVND
ncbi:tyrosine-type recombinase/integrase [Butyricicoccus intestinisimiae]|uniref:tyrosine-type recombinase/integrase n=1 Tax=Butyricicoccus intestinisimiae TaxID=2841509 RepID=UPI002ED3E868